MSLGATVRSGCGVEQFSLPYTVYGPGRARLSGMLSGVRATPPASTRTRTRNCVSPEPVGALIAVRERTILIVPSVLYELAGSAGDAVARRPPDVPVP